MLNFLDTGVIIYPDLERRQGGSSINKGYSHNPATNFLFYAPFGGGGTCDSSVVPVYLVPGYTTPSQPGRHSGGAKSLERFYVFGPFTRNTFSI